MLLSWYDAWGDGVGKFIINLNHNKPRKTAKPNIFNNFLINMKI